MECKVYLCYIEDDDYDGRDYHERVLNSICDGIWNMDICLPRDDIEKLGVMLIKMAHTRDTRGCGDY